MEQEIDKKQIQDIIKDYLQSGAFTDKKITDTPTDDLSVVNRKYVNLNGALSNRPKSSVASVGQRYFDTDNNISIYYTTAGWRNSVSSIVALNN